MKKYTITFIAIIISLFATAQNDTISVIGVISSIKPIQEKFINKRFEVKIKKLVAVSGKADSSTVFYIHSPAKQLLITDYKDTETYKDKIFYFILNINEERIVFIDAIYPNVLRGKCPKCNKPLQGFRFLGDSYAHYIYCCPLHGEIDEEWEYYE